MTLLGFPVAWSSVSGGMLFSLLIGAPVVFAAVAAHDAQRAASRPVRWVWFGSLMAIVALTVLSPMRRSAPSDFSRVAAAMSGAPANDTAPQMVLGIPWWQRARTAIARPMSQAMDLGQSALSQVPDPVHRGLGVVWLLSSVSMLGVLAVSYWRVRRSLRQWPVQRVADAMAVIAPTSGPAVVGLAPSLIILPAWLLSRSPEEQRLVVAHESEHVRAGDPWLLVLGCIAVAVMPWSPALWYALGRLRLAIELDCDRRVLRRGIPAASYGALLIDLSALRSSLPPAMPAFSCSGSYLERRLVAMTTRPSRFSSARRAAGAFIAAAAFVTACESKLPTSAEVDALDVASARKLATESALIEERIADYYVDGKKVSAKLAEEIVAGRIASVEIVGKSAGSAGQIRIATKGDSLVLIGDSITFEREVPRAGVSELPLDRSAAGKIVEGRPLAKATGRPLVVQGQPSRKFDGLILVNGKVVAQTEMDRLSPDDIATIEVVKGAAAQLLYPDPRAANGVIKVTMKPKP